MNASQSRAASSLMRATRSVIEQLEERRLMSAGAPDTTFGTGGQTITDFNGAVDDGHVLAQQSTGETVVLAGQDASYHLIRYDTHGNLESGFDVTPDVTRPRAMIVQSDDKILVLGTAIGANGSVDMAVERFNANGTADSDFGVRKVDFIDPVGGGSGDENGWGLAMDGSNIIVAGTTNFGGSDYAAVARISSDGATITPGEVDINAPGMEVFGVAVQSNGGIVVAGEDADTESNFAVARFTPALQIDPNFGDSGMAQIAYGNAVSVATDGNDIVIDGHSFDLDGSTIGGVGADIGTVMKLDGASGAQVWRTDLDFGGSNADAQGIAIQSDHKVVVGGMEFSFSNIGFIARLNGDGSMDNSFGSSGISSVSQPSGYSDTGIESVAIQSDGNIVGSGFATKFDSNTSTALDPDVLVVRMTGSDVVTPPNNDPVAVDDVKSTNANTPLTFAANDLTANDTDADNDALTVTSVTSPSANGGSVTFDGMNVTYTPAANFSGADTFTYTISDGKGGTDSATVTVNVAPPNHNPVANADAEKTDENVALTFPATALLANDTDADGDAITLTSVSATSASGGHVTFSNGQITYTPATDFAGSDTFTYSISDGHNGTATGTVTVTVLTPEQAIDDIISQVDTLHDDGLLNSGNTNSLMTKLDGAAAKLDSDQYSAAMNKIQSFINQVNDWMSSGKISSSIGQTLISSANDVLASIQAEMA